MNGVLQTEKPMRSDVTLLFTVPVILTSVLLLLVGGAAAWYVHQMNQDVSHLLADNLDCAVACERLAVEIQDTRGELEQYIHTGDRTNLETVVAAKSHTVQSLDDADRSATTQQVRNLLARTRQGHDEFFARFSVIVADGPAETLEQDVRAMSRQLESEVLAPAEELLAYNQRSVAQHSARSRLVADRVGLGLLTLGMCGAVAGLLTGFGMARNLSRRLEQREREALRAEQLAAVGQLATGLAHELRNPLTSMKILIQTAGEEGAEASLKGRDLTVLQEETERLERLVTTFLEFARPPTLEKTTFDVRGLVDQTIHLVSGPAAQRDVAIEYQPANHLQNVEADPLQIRQVLLNLLLNAMDALPGGGTVRVVTEMVRGGAAEWLVMQVADNGPGIPSDVSDRIFEPFVSTKETGTGLGLAICRRIVEAHGGTIRVENGKAGGAEFSVRLPIKATAANATVAESETTGKKVPKR
jgi:two-component system sensor histidine kinase HydH